MPPPNSKLSSAKPAPVPVKSEPVVAAAPVAAAKGGKKVVAEVDGSVCQEHGKVQPKERALMNFVLDDGTENVRAVLFSEQIAKLIPEENLKDLDKMNIFREDFLGSEYWLSGSVRKNQLFNNIEIIGSELEKVEPTEIIKILEKK